MTENERETRRQAHLERAATYEAQAAEARRQAEEYTDRARRDRKAAEALK